MSVDDGHDVGPGPVDLTVHVGFPILILAGATHGHAVQVVLDDALRRCIGRRGPPRNQVAVGIGRTPDADVTREIENPQIERGEHPAGKRKILTDGCLGSGGLCRRGRRGRWHLPAVLLEHEPLHEIPAALPTAWTARAQFVGNRNNRAGCGRRWRCVRARRRDSSRVEIRLAPHLDQGLLALGRGDKPARARDHAVERTTGHDHAVSQQENGFVRTQRLGHRPSQLRRVHDAGLAVVHRADIPHRHGVVPVHQRDGADGERDRLRRVSVNDGHDIRPGLVDLAMNVNFLELVRSRAADRIAVEVVLDDVARAHDAGGHIARDVVVVRVSLTADAHMTLSAHDVQLRSSQHPAGKDEALDQRLLGMRRHRLGRAFSRGGAFIGRAIRNDNRRQAGRPRQEQPCSELWPRKVPRAISLLEKTARAPQSRLARAL